MGRVLCLVADSRRMGGDDWGEGALFCFVMILWCEDSGCM